MWLKQQIASHNIANVETPGYKAKKVEFQDVLYETAQGTERISKPVVEEDGNTQARPDGIMSRWKRKNWSCGRPIPSIRSHRACVGQAVTLRYVINNTGK